MAFQAEVGSGTARASTTGFGNKVSSDLLTKLVQFCCSQHVATVAVNAGGTGYVVGDLLTLTHASAHLDAVFEVTSVSSGVITGLRINSSGAFAQQATSAAVGAGGSGYAVGDILQVQGGSSRMPAKFQVATLSGSAVATVTLYEGGGVYSSTPGNDAATLGVSNGFAGDDACELTVSYQSIVGTTGLSVTGGTGSGATVDITLAETGWAIDTRDSNDYDDGQVSAGDEKQLTLVGDASGFTNKPYVHMVTSEATSGLDTRHTIEILGSTAHNSSLTIANQPGISPSAHSSGSHFMPLPENNGNDVDFWFKVTDRFIYVQYNANPAANTDDGRYMYGAAGFYDRLGTESEDAYPMFCGSAGITASDDPTLGNSQNISSIAEQRWSSTSSFGDHFYDVTTSSWRVIHNSDTGIVGSEVCVMFPFGEKRNQETTSNQSYQIAFGDGAFFNTGIISRSRASSSRVLRRVPGTTSQFMLYPLVIVVQVSTNPTDVSDRAVGTIPGVFWIYNDDDSTAAAISNFSEDYITINGDRYRVFHNYDQTDRYQYIAVKEDV